MELENVSIIRWITKYGIKTEDGTPYTFKDYMFMYDPLIEMSRAKKDLVIYKAAQIGFSTAAILSSHWIAKNRKMDIIYTLPTATDVKDFAGGKINRIIAQNPIMQDWVKAKDTIEQKEVGENIIYFRGTFTEKAAMMVSSDLNIYDEIDASNQKVIEQYSTRLQASKHKLEWRFSHPSVPNNGVARYWEKSDQKHWFITCSHCKEEQFMEFPESFDEDKEIYVCKYCKGEIYDDDRRKGRWVQKKVNQKLMSGYWIPLFICPWVSAKDIFKYKREKSEEYFYNKVLGLPYVGSGNVVTEEVIMQNLTSEINQQDGRIVIGCDTGLTQYYVVGNQDGLFYYGKHENYDEIEKLLKMFDNSIAVFDAGGDLVKVRELKEKYLGRVFLCHYNVDRKTFQLVRWGKNKESANVNVDRNRMMQLVIDEFSDKRIPLQGDENDWYDYWLHWKNIYRVEKENHLGQMVRVWERAGDDHWCHATLYWRVGMERFGHGEGAIIGAKTPLIHGVQKGRRLDLRNRVPAPNTKLSIKKYAKK